MSQHDEGLPIEEFIQALTSQLDRAQTAMALKARFGLPLTFAVKEISIDLRAHVAMAESQVLIRPAGPNEGDASVIHMALTTITRPMIEENTFEVEADEPSLKDVLGDEVTDEERRRLEWAGIRSVSQLRKLQRESGEHVVEQIVQIPAMRLRSALMRASQPRINRVSAADENRLRIRGRNLMQDDRPMVRIEGEPVPVLEATETELLVAPMAHQMSGLLAIETGPELMTEMTFAFETDRLAPDIEAQLSVEPTPDAFAFAEPGGEE